MGLFIMVIGLDTARPSSFRGALINFYRAKVRPSPFLSSTVLMSKFGNSRAFQLLALSHPQTSNLDILHPVGIRTHHLTGSWLSRLNYHLIDHLLYVHVETDIIWPIRGAHSRKCTQCAVLEHPGKEMREEKIVKEQEIPPYPPESKSVGFLV